MKNTVKIILAATGAVALAGLAYYLYSRNHKVDVVEINNDSDEKPEAKSDECEKTYDPTLDNFFIHGDDGMPLYGIGKAIKEETKPKYDIPPYEISQETFVAKEPKFEKHVLWYDSEIGEFADELENVLYDKNGVLGDWNIKRFLEEDVDYMYIRNENKSADYELIK